MGCSGPHCTNKASMPLQVKILPQIAQIFTEVFRGGQNYRIAKNVHTSDGLLLPQGRQCSFKFVTPL